MGGADRKSPETKLPGATDADVTDKLSVMQIPGKEDAKKELTAQGPASKEEENGARGTQEALVRGLDEDNSASPMTHLNTEEAATLEEEEERPPEPAWGDDQPNPDEKRHDSSVPRSGLEEKTQSDQEPLAAERGRTYSSPPFKHLREKTAQRADVTGREHQNQAPAVGGSSPGPHDGQPTSEIVGCLVFFNDS